MLIAVRLAVLSLLYLFLIAALWVVGRDVALAAPVRGDGAAPAGLVAVDSVGGTIQAGRRIPVEGAASIGRDSDNQVVVRDSTVSGRHCAVYFRDGRWWVEDLGSTNGTWLNDREVHAPEPVKPGDLLQVGRAAFHLQE